MKKQPANRKALIIIISIVAAIAVLTSGLSYFRYKSMHHSWNKTTEITLKYSEAPAKNIYWEEKVSTTESVWGGPVDNDTDNSATVRIATTPDNFREILIAEAAKNVKNKKYTSEIKTFFDTYTYEANTSLEDLLKKIEVLDGTFKTDFVFYAKNYATEELIQKGLVSIYDTNTNKYVDSITYTDKGFVCGPLCGSGSSKYTLPNGKIIRSSRWIS